MEYQRETVGLSEGGRPKKTGSQSDPVSTPTLAAAGIDKHLADRARKMAAVPEAKFEAALGEWRERVRKFAHAMFSKPHYSTGCCVSHPSQIRVKAGLVGKGNVLS
tara:strand:- start:5121 stop:5438 length:318 start_codon:yes stop_codon:yes gene_type:complete